jgi:Tfp pilus assembly protein FimT
MAIGLRSVAGLTVIELVIVITIVGILVSIAVPNYLDWNRKYQLKEAVGTLQATISLARTIAVNQNKNVTVTVCQNVTPCPVGQVNPTLTQVTVFFQSANLDVIPKMTMVPGITLTNAGGTGVASPQDVQFTPMGRPAPFSSTLGGANNLCINPDGSTIPPPNSCGGTPTAQALNLMNTNGLNYRIVITSTGKAAWGYSPTLAP